MNKLSLIKRIVIFTSNLISYLITSYYGFRKFGRYNNRLLVINTEKMGDIILSIDFLISLRKENQFGQYDLIIADNFKDLFDWKELNYNAVIINKNKYRYNLFYRIKFLKQIRRNRYVHVLNITQERGMINEELSLLSGAPRIIAMKETSLYLPNFFLKRNNKEYSEILDSQDTNEYKRLTNYLLKNDIPLIAKDGVFGSMSLSLNSIDNKLVERKYVIMAPMASEMDRSWGIDNYKKLCPYMQEQIILIGKESEREILDSFKSTGDHVINLAGKLSFNEIAYLMKNCSFYIGNDSGLTHLAHQMNTPMIAIIGGGKYGKFFPYKEREDALFISYPMKCIGCDWRCIEDSKYCLTKVTPELVYDKILLLRHQLHEN